MYEKIHELARDKVIEGIVELKDLSNDRNGIRIEIETKKDVQVEVLLNQLYKLTPVQSSFGINNNVLVNNAPMTLPLKELIRYYIDHQIEVIERRTRYDLNEDEKRAMTGRQPRISSQKPTLKKPLKTLTVSLRL